MLSFLKLVLFDPLTREQPSLEQHCISLLEERGKSFCKQSLNRRFNDRAVVFLQTLFERYLQDQFLSRKLTSGFSDHFSSIRLMDSTEFKLPSHLAPDFPGFDGDGTASCTQIQFEYDILSGKIIDLSLGDARIADSAYATPLLDNIRRKDLIIRDLGYSKIDSFKEVEAKGAYYISRLNPHITIYERRGDRIVPLSYKTILQRLKGRKKGDLDIPIYLGRQAKHPVRLTANLLPPEAVTRRLSKKIYQSNDTPQTYNYLREMNLFITNVPKEILSVAQIYGLYRIRWQIELVFKTWKGVLKIDQVRKMKADRFRCYLLGRLLWVVLNWEICSIFNAHLNHSKGVLLSFYKCFAIIKQQAHSLEHIILHRKVKLREWLRTLFDLISRFGLKEHRRGRADTIKLLALNE
jgi:hypothetical protein